MKWTEDLVVTGHVVDMGALVVEGADRTGGTMDADDGFDRSREDRRSGSRGSRNEGRRHRRGGERKRDVFEE